MRALVVRRFFQLIHNMLRRWQVRIAHSKVNDVFAACARRCFHLIDFSKKIRRNRLMR